MLKKTLLLFSIIILTGCSTVTKDHYFDSYKETKSWKYTFIPGKNDTKSVGYPDSVLFTLNKPNYHLDLKVLSYQNLNSVGPVILPIIPLPLEDSRLTKISIDIETEEEFQINLEDWVLIDLESNKQYKAISVSTKQYGEHEKMQINHVGKYFITFPVDVSKLNRFKLEFGSIKIKNKKEEIEAIFLQRKKGTTRYSQFTV